MVASTPRFFDRKPYESEFGGQKRYFLKWLFGKKSATTTTLRPGAMPPEQVKETIERFGVGTVVEILRVGFDGTLDDIPIVVEIIDISPEGFTGKIVNVERKIIEESTANVVFAKHGGGTIEFRYDDGDIAEIKEGEDTSVLEQSRDVAALKEILNALEPNDNILVAYYDRAHHGTVNVEGRLVEKSADGNSFKMVIEKVNRIELEQKKEKHFDIDKDLVIDIELV